MRGTKPRVSIGLPVFNGENYLKEVIDSVVAQSYRNFELIISDNDSTDCTAAICKQYAAGDTRIRYFRNPQNLGLVKNLNRVVELSRGEYFMWVAHDDELAPEYLQKCVTVLDGNPAVVLCCSRVKIIDEYTNAQRPHPVRLKQIGSTKPHDRFGELIKNDLHCFEIFGLIRKPILQRTPLFAKFVASDRTLRAELGLRGQFYEIPEHLFFYRDHPDRSSRTMPSHHQRAAFFDPSKAGKRVLPHWRIFGEYFKCANRVRLTIIERIQCYLHVLSWPATHMHWAWMLLDLILAIHPDAWKFFFKLRRDKEWVRAAQSKIS